MKKHILIAIFTSFILAVTPACNTLRGTSSVENYNADPLQVPVPVNTSPEKIQKDMIRAFTNRGWTVVETSPDKVVAELDHRGFDAQATMVREGDAIKIYSNSTYYVKQRDEVQPAVPLGWLENLQKDLNTYLKRGF